MELRLFPTQAQAAAAFGKEKLVVSYFAWLEGVRRDGTRVIFSGVDEFCEGGRFKNMSFDRVLFFGESIKTPTCELL